MKTTLNRPLFNVTYGTPSHTPPVSQTNDELVEEYLAWKKSYTSTAYLSYRLWVRRFQSFVNKPPELMAYNDYVAFAHSLDQKFAPANIQYALSIVHNYLRFYLEQGRLRFPLFLVRIPRAFLQSHQAIAEDEYRKIIEVLRKKPLVPVRDLLVIMLLHDTGLRIGELLGLQIEDIEEDYSAIVRTEKTTRQRRVFWNADTDNILQQYLVERINRGPVDYDALFVAKNVRTPRPLSSRSVQRMLKSALGEAGNSRTLTPHSFRHAFVHRLAKLGVPDAIIAQLVGHSTPHSVANYTKLSRPEFREYAKSQLAFAENLA